VAIATQKLQAIALIIKIFQENCYRGIDKT